MNLYDKASLIVTPNAYKAGKLYALKPTNGSGDFMFSRASSAMRRNASGFWEAVPNNVPRLHYPVGGGCPVWLFEPQRTKVWKQSNNIASASYTYIGVVALDAETIAEDTSTGSHLFLQVDAGVVTGSRYTWSAKIKANGRSRIEIRDNATGGGSCFIDLSNGTKWSPDSVGVSRITPDTDGYYFIEFSFTATSTANYNINIRLKNALNADSYTGDGVSGIKIKDIGFEEGAYATSFLQTTTASVTRIEDVISSKDIIDLPSFTLLLVIAGHKTYSGSAGFLTFSASGAEGNVYLNSGNSLKYYSSATGYLGAYGSTEEGCKLLIRGNGAGANNITVFKDGVNVAQGSNPNSSLNQLDFTFLVSTLIGPISIYDAALSDAECIELTT